jgi:diacylglycerol kinase family enzyme
MDFKKSLALIDSSHTIPMDSFVINNKLSVNVSGIGFDGHVAGLFAKEKKRGLIGYSKLIVKEFFSFHEFSIEIAIDHTTYKREAFVLAFANSSQFGNNACVSPHASVCDGLLDVCFIRKVPIVQTVGFVQKMFTSQIEKSPWVDIVQAKHLTLSFDQPMPYHVDGEAMKPERNFSITIQPASINMAIPKDSANQI